MIECRNCSKTQDPDLFTNDMVRRQAGKQQDRQDRQDITTVYNEFTEIAHTKIPSRAVKKLRDFEHTIKNNYLIRALLKRKFGNLDGDHVLSIMFRYVQNQDYMIVLSAMFRMAIVAGYSTSTEENSFSARNRVDTDRRRRLSPYKQGDLSLLHFESALLQSLTFEDFLKVWKEKSRRSKV